MSDQQNELATGTGTETGNGRGVVFPLLADPQGYRPHTIDMARNETARDEWLGVFEHHLPGVTKLAIASQPDRNDTVERAAAFAEDFGGVLAGLRRDPNSQGELSILKLCGLRRGSLVRHGFDDPYLEIKQNENAEAMKLLPSVLDEIDALDDKEKPEALIRGLFAGNIFDLGCAGTVEMYESGEMDFRTTRDRLPDRPWLIDDFDLLIPRLTNRAPNKTLMFIDNAGADMVLGVLPLVRHLLKLGSEVVLAANTTPALNDVIYTELLGLLDEASGIDEAVGEAVNNKRLRAVPSGNGLPVIDLRLIDERLVAECDGVDLLAIQGMGRALETNLDARFTCDTLKTAMVKEQDVADYLNGKLYDVVCRFEPA